MNIQTKPARSATPEISSQTARTRASVSRAPTHEEISLRAYRNWMDAGSPHGRHEDFWIQAERELCGLNDIALTDDSETLTQKLRDAEPNFPPRGTRSVTSL